VENEGKPESGFPSLFPSPWKSLRDFHILHSAGDDFLWTKNNPKPKKGTHASRSPDFYSFRLILRLENAPPPDSAENWSVLGE
jgi:hypothetical protein